MQHDARIRLRLANDRIAARVREADDARLAEPHRPSVRRTVGRSLIRIGERVAAEAPLRPARSR